MTKYRRKAVDVEAMQFDPTLPKEQWPEGVHEYSGHWSQKDNTIRNFGFRSPGGASRINPGDWIVTNQTGERYVVLAESFDATYERV